MNQERRRFDLSTHGHQISHSVVPSTMQPPALSLHTCRAFRTCRGQTCWIDRTLQEDWNIENTEISYPGISRQATWHMARPSTLFFFLAAKSGDTRWWHPDTRWWHPVTLFVPGLAVASDCGSPIKVTRIWGRQLLVLHPATFWATLASSKALASSSLKTKGLA